MEPSEEIKRVVARWTKAIADGDKECLARLSEHDGTLLVGTDPAEWWRGPETRAVWGQQIEELRGAFSVRADEIDRRVAKHRVGDVHVAAACVCHVHPDEPKPANSTLIG